MSKQNERFRFGLNSVFSPEWFFFFNFARKVETFFAFFVCFDIFGLARKSKNTDVHQYIHAISSLSEATVSAADWGVCVMEIGRDWVIWESNEENKYSFPSDSLGVYLEDIQSRAV